MPLKIDLKQYPPRDGKVEVPVTVAFLLQQFPNFTPAEIQEMQKLRSGPAAGILGGVLRR